MNSCCCIDVDDRCEVIAHKTRTARKDHKCNECGAVIPAGEEYEVTDSLFDGKWSQHKMCWFCVKIREDFFSCGWYFGRLREDFYECNGWDYINGPKDDDWAAEIDGEE